MKRLAAVALLLVGAVGLVNLYTQVTDGAAGRSSVDRPSNPDLIPLEDRARIRAEASKPAEIQPVSKTEVQAITRDLTPVRSVSGAVDGFEPVGTEPIRRPSTIGGAARQSQAAVSNATASDGANTP